MPQLVKNLPAVQETRGSIPGSGRIPWRREWQPTPVFLPEESHGRRSLMGYSPWDCKESDTTDRLTYTLHRLAVCLLKSNFSESIFSTTK